MKRIYLTLKTVVFSIGLLFSLSGCEDHQDRFNPPPWLKGNNLVTLTARSDEAGPNGPTYYHFIELMELAGYKQTVNATNCTLFVPNDSAFEVYFRDAGISGIGDLTKKQAQELFTLHYMKNPRSRFDMVYEFIWDELQGPNGEYAALFFRKPTSSTSQPYSEYVRYYPDFQGETLLVYTGDKLIPLFSTDYFEDFSGNPDGSDYLFMYRNSHWKNDFNWGPAMVTESQVKTSNGFLYFIDMVVPPQENIDQFLGKNQDKYGVFYDLIQRFAHYDTPKEDPFTKKQMYLKGYDMISDLAEEQGAFTGNENKRKDMYSLFLPTDQVLTNYLNNTVLKYYPSIDSVPKVTLYYIIQSQISRSLALISKIEKRFFNSFGDPMTISRSIITDAHPCSNGVIYETNTVLEPFVFSCVPGRLFFDKNYATMLFAINSANLTASLAVPDLKVTLFAPNNDCLEQYGVRYSVVEDVIQWRGKDYVYNNMKTDELLMFVEDHIHDGVIDDMSGEGYIKMNSDNYIHYSANKVYNAENQYLNEEAEIVETSVNDQNGMLYMIDKPLKSKFIMGKLIMTDPDYSRFATMLSKNGMLTMTKDNLTKDTIWSVRFLSELSQWTAFLPTNAALQEAVDNGIIPQDSAAVADSIKNFINYHFIRKNVIFDDGALSGVVPTQRVERINDLEGTVYATLRVDNTAGNLTVTDHSGQVVAVEHVNANRLVRKGVAHKINHALKY